MTKADDDRHDLDKRLTLLEVTVKSISKEWAEKKSDEKANKKANKRHWITAAFTVLVAVVLSFAKEVWAIVRNALHATP